MINNGEELADCASLLLQVLSYRNHGGIQAIRNLLNMIQELQRCLSLYKSDPLRTMS